LHLGDERREDLVDDRGQDPFVPLVVVQPLLCKGGGVRGRVRLVRITPPSLTRNRAPPRTLQWQYIT
jgi:hypothetical protein